VQSTSRHESATTTDQASPDRQQYREFAKRPQKGRGGELNSAGKEWTFRAVKRGDGGDPEDTVFQLEGANYLAKSH